MTHDRLDSAYATLGLRKTASAAALRQRYLALVRQWHPDRFANDPQGVADATLMLKAINHACATIVEQRLPGVITAATPRPDTPCPPSAAWHDGRLSPDQVAEIIEAVRHSQALSEHFFEDDDFGGWGSRASSAAVAIAYSLYGCLSDEKSGGAAFMEAVLIPSLICIWFPATLDKLNSRSTQHSPARLVWMLAWLVLLMPGIATAIAWSIAR